MMLLAVESVDCKSDTVIAYVFVSVSLRLAQCFEFFAIFILSFLYRALSLPLLPVFCFASSFTEMQTLIYIHS